LLLEGNRGVASDLSLFRRGKLLKLRVLESLATTRQISPLEATFAHFLKFLRAALFLVLVYYNIKLIYISKFAYNALKR